MLKRLCMSLALIMLIAAPASAQSVGGYASVKFLDSYQTHWGGGILSSSHSQNTVGAAFALGYDFFVNSDFPVRAEVEYAVRTDFNSDKDVRFGGDNWNSDLRYNVQTLLANFYYDFYNESEFTPYVSGGIGAAFVTGKIGFTRNNGNETSRSIHDTNFAWAVGGGVGYMLTDAVTADLGYRYMNVGTSRTQMQDNDLDITGSAHEFTLGLRFGF